MKTFSRVVTVIASVVLISSLALAAESKVGTVKSIDSKAGLVVFSPEGGAEVTLKIDKNADVSKIKAGDKVEVSVEKDTLHQIKLSTVKRKAAIGC
jgi:hypothetical protein